MAGFTIARRIVCAIVFAYMKAILSLLAGALCTSAATAEEFAPGEPFDYPAMAFYPDRWEEKGLDGAPMVPWKGRNIALVTTQQDLDADVMKSFVGHLDDGWEVYRELTGKDPRPLKMVEGLATICALPARGLSCGYGCGYVGATGIEMIRFYDGHYLGAQKDPKNVPHAYFYEMGRNFFTFGDRHNCFTTGFAVFMRYVCIDTLELNDGDKRTRRVINEAIDIYENDESLEFIGTFTTFGEHGEKGNRLKDKDGKELRPTDQNVMYASLMLKLRDAHGGNDFVKTFYHQLHTVPSLPAKDAAGALKQSIALAVCASLAAGEDLTPMFVEKYRLPVTEDMQSALAAVEWTKAELTAGDILRDIKVTAN